MICGIAPTSRRYWSAILEPEMRILIPWKSDGLSSGRLAETMWKPLSQKARPLIPFGSSLVKRYFPTDPFMALA